MLGAVRGAVSRSLIRAANPTRIQSRSTSFVCICGPPKVKSSFMEKMILGSVMISASVIPSFYIIYMIPHYGKGPVEE